LPLTKYVALRQQNKKLIPKLDSTSGKNKIIKTNGNVLIIVEGIN
jgi:hypothetical protein